MKWISIEKELPKEKEGVLVYTPSFTYKKINISWLEQGKWFRDYEGDCCSTQNALYYEPDEVTHWQPLPAAPKDFE